MTTIMVNLDSLHRTQSGPVPAGRYDAVVYDLLEVTSKAGNPYTRLTFEIIDGQHTDAEATSRGAFVGRRIVCSRPWMMAHLLIAAEVVTPGQTGEIPVERESLIDYPVVIDLSIGEFNGKPQNNVEAIFGVEQVPQPLPSISEDLPF